jgi:adenylate cyclase
LRNRARRGVLVGIAAFALAGLFQVLGLFRVLEWKSWDARLRLFADPARADRGIALVLVDQYSLDVVSKEQSVSWPWPREYYSYLVEYLRSGNAAAYFFDIAMTEPSVYGVADDKALARSAAAAGRVFFPVALSEADNETDADALAMVKTFSTPALGPGPVQTGRTYRSLTAPVPALLGSAAGIANVQVNPDDDGIYRRMPMAFRFRDSDIPSVPWALARFVKKDAAAAAAAVPLDPSGQMIIRFWGGAGTYRSYPMAALINSWAQIQEGRSPQVPPSEFAGKVVLVGLSAVGLHDLKASPLSPLLPGVEIHAAALDTLLQRRFIRVVPGLASAVFVALLALSAGVVASLIRKTGVLIAAFVGLLAVPVMAAVVAFAGRFWLNFVFPESAVLLTLTGAAALNYGVEGKERRFIKGAFHHYLSPAVIDGILKNPDLLRLGGEERDVTSFFSDIAGFTSVSEKLAPPDLVALLNAYLTEMTDIILDAGGTLDKYEGDAIVAFWNAPLDDPDHALRACRAALACQAKLSAMAPELEARFGQALRMRIGLNSGPAVVGNMGSRRRFDYTAMGDTVNLAARLESACKQYRVAILAGESTVRALRGEFVVRDVDRVRVVGRAEPCGIFEPVGPRDVLTPVELERLKIYHDGLAFYRLRRWDRAEELFRSLDGDGLSVLYAERCRRYFREPPPEPWDGVTDLISK